MNRPDVITRSTTISGLGAGESIVGIDFRPLDGRLYGLGTTSRIYVIDTTTAVATTVGAAFTPVLDGSFFGVDFNPVVDRIRVHSTNEQNLRIVPTTGAVAAADAGLAYAAGDPGAGTNPDIVGTAYTNSVAGALTTTLFAIDRTRGALVTLATPNDGQLTTVGIIGGVGVSTGFDIAGGDAFLTLQGPSLLSNARLFRVNLATGAITLVGEIPNTVGGVHGIAVSP